MNTRIDQQEHHLEEVATQINILVQYGTYFVLQLVLPGQVRPVLFSRVGLGGLHEARCVDLGAQKAMQTSDRLPRHIRHAFV